MELLKGPVLLITNPAARRGRLLEQRARAALRAAGADFDVVVTTHAGHAAVVATERAPGVAAVLTLGGDGTAMEVIGALAHSGTPVGVLPGGTGNLVARALRTPRRIERAVPALLAGDLASVDLGYIPECNRRFAFSTGVGVDARMIDETHPETKRRFGIAAYVHTGVRVGLSRRPFDVRVEVDGESIERHATSVMIANFGTVLDRLFTLGPGIRQDDGLLDLCLFSPPHTAAAMAVAWRLLRRDFRTDASALYRSGREFRIECDPPQLYQADGELLGTTPYTVRVEPLAARLLVARHD
ncbi:MAG TPA: diacylglycerol kinase family protein [Gemmatimonadaceae bacterium]|nr:diacylglycerol kinase family protein [Gemmatimonadaceae bacterium]